LSVRSGSGSRPKFLAERPVRDRRRSPMMKAEEESSVLRHMRLHVSDPQLVPSLLAFLRERVHVVAEQVGPQEVEVSQLGSGDRLGRRLELELMLQAWRAAHEHVETRVVG
jgi:hypothetical protein